MTVSHRNGMPGGPKRRDECDPAYSHMAPHYDFLLNHVDYRYWYNYIKMIMQVYHGIPRTVLEIGTGTGRFGSYFSRDGYTIVGLDLSVDMLQTARLRAYNNFSLVAGDARALPFGRPFDFIFSVHDTMNYITNMADLEKVFRSVLSVMDADSVFLFDLTTEYNVRTNFDAKVHSYEHNGWKIDWANEYDSGRRIIESVITFTKGDIVKEEIHTQRIYTTDEVLGMLQALDFVLVELYADYTYERPGPKTIMKNFVVKKR